ncbi:MAG: rod shape-determining protein MreD [Candidatus Rokubacteria bacterium]|jgi:rod shape-determining protein MreD|nr:rod shape-determining protein MreD [Candidatus Rokubacteria bacterium]
MRSALLLVIFGGGLAQTTFAPALRIGDITPDIPLVMVVLLALRRGPEIGCLSGFVTGLLQDAAGGGFIGAQALTKTLVGFCVGQVGGRLWVQEPLVQIPGLVALSLLEGIARFLLLQIFHFPGSFGDLMLYIVLPQSLYNGVVGAAVVLTLAGVERLRGWPSWR